MKLARLLLRVTIGTLFIGHGTQKLFGWFGGDGLKGTAETFEGMGLKPGQVNATAAGVAETAGGAGVLLGFKTPFAASAVISVMLTAINRVHLKKGPWIQNGGYEYNALLIAGAASVASMGPGRLSLDGKKQRSGVFWGLTSLVLGAAGATGAHVFAETQSGATVAEPYEAPTTTAAPEATDVAAADAPIETEAPVDPSAGDEAVDGEIQPETHTAGEPGAAE